jgi:hypothetical protein
LSAVERSEEAKKRQRARNWAVSGALLGFVVIVYIVAILRMGGH